MLPCVFDLIKSLPRSFAAESMFIQMSLSFDLTCRICRAFAAGVPSGSYDAISAVALVSLRFPGFSLLST